MIWRRRAFWIAGLILVLGFGLLIFRDHRPTPPGILSSAPQFGYRTYAGRAQPIISFLVSNTGLTAVRFNIPWLECRAPSASGFASRKLVLVGTAARSILLAPRVATNVVMALEDEQPHAPGLLFCCQISWVEDFSGVEAITGLLSRPIYYLGALMGFNWSPPSRTRVALGDVFLSNLDVAEYFSRTWGLTSSRLDEEKRMLRKIQEQKRRELARIQASLPTNEMVRYGTGNAKDLTEQERAEIEAKSAFEQFCRASTNNPAGAEPSGPADGSQRSGSSTNRTPGTAGSGR